MYYLFNHQILEYFLQGSLGWQTVLKNQASDFEEMEPDPREAEDQLLAEAGGRVAEAKLWLAIELYRYIEVLSAYAMVSSVFRFILK